MPKICDNTSVGVVIQDRNGKLALLERARWPVGIAPVSGNIDDHGSPERAAIEEVEEEVGLITTKESLKKTKFQNHYLPNACRRTGGDHHTWWVYEVNDFAGEIRPSPDETKGASWYDRPQVQELADRTKALRAGTISQEEWEAPPGLEGLWLDFLAELGYVT